ncbi:outer membrane protein assembly factor BamB family protein [Actinomadura montaniterrae]|uniref:PQQ-binding-like beta-propeller repeat protein n=1 Tax=Actinomadura montaniterrae TaxID=1803903 RepID=A0A6L3W3H3_9ACTN|nr:PQQ-binding-like beta-propeller repeat protein [Actinomadura montaniterrae]KAB2388817.1 PQQ-binding-like beta-propeller repeat protein [Actinomadura montaniterrae]
MTDDSEPHTRPSSTTPRVETVMSWTADEPAVRRRGRWWRLRVVVAALIAVVLASWGVPRLWAVFDDGMRGPYGRFPQPVGTQPPVHSAQRVATVHVPLSERTVIYGGLAIMPAGDDVRAVNIVTGRVYWRYTKSMWWPTGIDRSTGDVFLESTSGELVKINVRSGKIQWSRKVSDDIGNKNSVVPDADATTLVLLGSHGMAGISRATGKVRWTKKWPRSCPDQGGPPVAVVPGTLAVACEDYDAPDKAVFGFDPATGAMRWTLTLSPVSQPGDVVDALGVVGGRLAVAEGDTTDLLDPATGRIVAKQRWKDQYALAMGGGLQVSSCEDKKDNAICGFDPATGAELWRRPIPESGHLPQLADSLAVADGRIYIMSANDTGVFHLVVFDGRTGKILGRIPIFSSDPAFIYGPVTDGIIAIGDTSSTDLYAERPDIRSTRRLPS